MPAKPLLGTEVQRIRAAFEAASRELSAALRSLSEADLDHVGTPIGNSAVATGLSDLRGALERLQGIADDCVAAAWRQLGELGIPSAPPPAQDT